MNIQKFLLIIFFVKTFFQVRSLYDGLSHLYTDCDSRLRHIPSTNYADKKRKDESTGKKSILHTFNFTNFFYWFLWISREKDIYIWWFNFFCSFKSKRSQYRNWRSTSKKSRSSSQSKNFVQVKYKKNDFNFISRMFYIKFSISRILYSYYFSPEYLRLTECQIRNWPNNNKLKIRKINN